MRHIYKVLSNVLGHPLNRRAKFPAMLRFVRWQIASRAAPGKIAVDWIRGTQFFASRGEAGVTGNIYSGLSDFEEMAFAIHFLRRDDVFVDIGANAGIYTILASGAVGARSISFEPAPATYGRLKANIALNNIGERVSAHNRALGASSGELLFSNSYDCMNRVVADGNSCGAIKVAVSRMDDIVREPVTMIKLDVEGFEKPVLDGASQTLSTPELQALIVELNGSGAVYGHTDDHVITQLGRHGFEPFTYLPYDRRLIPQTATASRPPNLIFVRDRASTESRLAASDPVTVCGVTF